MKTIATLLGFAVTLLPVSAAEPKAAGPVFVRDAQLQHLVDDTVAQALTGFASNKLGSNQIAVTLIDLNDPGHGRIGSFRGEAPIYPASVVKLFYLAAAHRWLADGKLADTPELRRALHDMIVDSSNDATHYVLDVLSGTTSGPELPEAEMREWGEKRNAVNRYFASLGYRNINANQKTWCEGPYGRDRIWVGTDYHNRNSLTTDATARLLMEIALGQCVSAERSAEMMKLLLRDRNDKSTDPDNQARGFSSIGLPAGAKLWSKAGWTSTARHDAAYVELPSGRKFVLVTFTTGHANEREIIAFVARTISASL